MRREFLARWREDVNPMNSDVFEGLNRPPSTNLPCMGFDVETYSLNGFPRNGEDPVVAATLAISMDRDPGKGLTLLSLVYPPSREVTLLTWLYSFLSSSRGSCLVTYNGVRFDLPYVIRRGRMCGIDFEDVFSNCEHLDLYEVVRKRSPRLPGYGQKTVERFMGIDRVVNDVSGAFYHEVFQNFLVFGSLKPLIYNIEDSVGCLNILKRLSVGVEGMA